MDDKPWWGFWSDYPKVVVNGRVYAQIGNRLYSHHVVARFLPSGRRTIAGVPVADKEGGGHMYSDKARSIPPRFMEDAIARGAKVHTIVDGELRTVHELGDLRVVTTRDEKIVISALYTHEG